MPDSPAKGRRTGRAAEVTARLAGLNAVPDPEATAERSERASSAAADRKRKAPATTRSTVRAAPMPAETRAPREYKARVSHATTYEQLDALEEVSRAYRRAHGIHVPITALLRAAAAICLDNAQLRERMARDAAVIWNPPREVKRTR